MPIGINNGNSKLHGWQDDPELGGTEYYDPPIEVRIRRKIADLRRAMGEYEFLEWYTGDGIPFASELLERVLDAKLAEFNPADDPERVAEAVALAYMEPVPLDDDLGESPTDLRSLYGYG